MKYQEFKKIINKPYFNTLDILFHNLKVYPYQLSLWQKMGYIGHLKRGIFFFIDEKEKITNQDISFLIYSPSYISMEFALNYYGLIPEIVYAKTSITTKTTRNFYNDFGIFIYRHIKPELFFGYIPIETLTGKYLLAEPEKALLDYLYFNLGKLKDRGDIEELRINYFELNKIIDRKKLNLYLKEFNIKKLSKLTSELFKIC